jgi:uncharacterized protein YbcI
VTDNANPRLRISNEIVHLRSEYYGRGPSKAKTYIQDDLVVVVLEETFTPAERTLIDRGEGDPIHDLRRRFQQVMGPIQGHRRGSHRASGARVHERDLARRGRGRRGVPPR